MTIEEAKKIAARVREDLEAKDWLGSPDPKEEESLMRR